MTLARRWERERRIVLRPGRLRHAGLLLVSLVFVAIGFWMGLSGDDLFQRVVGWVGVAFFGLGLFVFAAQFVQGASSLTLDPEGFTVVSLWRRRRYHWREVQDFHVRAVGQQVMILFDVPADGGRAARTSRALFGVSHGLPDSYGLRPEQLAAFMALVRDWANTRDVI
jgi:hypothetical protein